MNRISVKVLRNSCPNTFVAIITLTRSRTGIRTRHWTPPLPRLPLRGSLPWSLGTQTALRIDFHFLFLPFAKSPSGSCARRTYHYNQQTSSPPFTIDKQAKAQKEEKAKSKKRIKCPYCILQAPPRGLK